MDTKDKDLAVKIFDHFILSKHKILYWSIYSRFSIDSFYYCFCLDCCILTADSSDVTECCLTFDYGGVGQVASFIIKDYVLTKEEFISSVYKQEGSHFSDIPDNLKAIVIEECLKRNEALYASSINDNLNIMLMPAAKSLEELAIMMELEK